MDGDQQGGGSHPPAPPEEPPEEAVPAALLAQWRRAEERLYPMVMVVPENYERVVRLVGQTTVELQLACPDLASLVEAAPQVPDRVRRRAAGEALGDGVDVDLVAGAACLLRFRQLEAEARRDQQIRRIAGALEQGSTWLTVVEAVPATTWPPLPSTTVEMHLASGRALEQTIAMDPDTGGARFTLAEVQLDPRTGERARGEGRVEQFDQRGPWQEALAARRREIELGH